MVLLKRLLIIKTRLPTIQTLAWTRRDGNSGIPAQLQKIYGCKCEKKTIKKGAIEQKKIKNSYQNIVHG